MNSIDVTILIILGFFCIKGFFRGFIMEIFTLVGLVLAYVIAIRQMNSLASLINNIVRLPALVATTLSFFLIFILVVLFCRWIAGALRKITRWTLLGWIDRGGGILFGLFKGALVVSLLALLVSLIPTSQGMETEEENSLLFRPARSVAPAVFNFIKHTFPQTKNFYDEVKEGFINKSREVTDSVLSKRLESLRKELKNRVK